jgi:hypothetical protein
MTTKINIEFANICIPAIGDKKIIDFEYHPVQRVNDEGDIQQCEPKDAEFWSVYIHYDQAGLDCISDHETEKEAKAFCDFLNFILNGAKTKEQKQLEKALMFLCDGEKTVAEQVEIIRNHPDKDDIIDWIDGVDVVNRFESSFTAESFINEIEY